MMRLSLTHWFSLFLATSLFPFLNVQAQSVYHVRSGAAGAGNANTPTDEDTWGGVEAFFGMDANPASPVASGTGLGVGCFQSSSGQARIDNWFGGDTP